jgi:TRADD-N domain-containing protein
MPTEVESISVDERKPDQAHASGEGANTGETKETPPKASGSSRVAQSLASLFGRGWPTTTLTIVVALLGIAVIALLVYLCWIRAIPALRSWDWGFDRADPARIGRGVLALLGLMYLAIIPFLPIGIAPWVLTFLAEVTSYRQDVKTAREAQQNIEETLATNDPHQIVMVLRYSRELLGEYYALGMHQAQRSYRYALIAMWLGFIVLLGGVTNQLGWLKALFPETFTEVADDNAVVLLTGAVMEFIAAAFLWVYRTSTQQLIYFYRRQLMLHRTLLASRIAKGMAHKAEDATLMIIQKVLEDVDELKTDAATGGGISKLLQKT